MPPPAIVMGAVNDAPTPELEIFSEVTEASVVGNAVVPAGGAGPAAFVSSDGAEATTEESFVGKSGGAVVSLAGEVDGVSPAFDGSGLPPALIFSRAVC